MVSITSQAFRILNGMAVTKYLENVVLVRNVQNIEMKVRKN